MSDLNDKDQEDFKFDLQLFADGEGEGGEDGFPYPYMSQFPDELKKDEFFRPDKTLGDVGKGFKGARAKINSTPTAPEKASEYELPEDEKTDKDSLDWFRKTVFDLKVPKETAEKLYAATTQYAGEKLSKRDEERKKEIEKSDELMHGEWGEKFDENMKLVDKAYEDLGGDELRKVLENVGIDTNPVILKALKQIGFEHSEDKIREGVVAGSPSKNDLDEEYPSMKGM